MYSSLITYAAVGVSESIDRTTPLSERLGIGFEVLILGMGTVFAVLALLWGILEIFRLVFARPAKTAAPVEVPAVVPEAVEEESDDGEIIAAITAAVAAYIDAENEAAGSTSHGCFKVVSYKKLGK